MPNGVYDSELDEDVCVDAVVQLSDQAIYEMLLWGLIRGSPLLTPPAWDQADVYVSMKKYGHQAVRDAIVNSIWRGYDWSILVLPWASVALPEE